MSLTKLINSKERTLHRHAALYYLVKYKSQRYVFQLTVAGCTEVSIHVLYLAIWAVFEKIRASGKVEYRLKINVFQDLPPCSVVDRNRSLRGM